jgi:hypothetical protein
MKILLAGDSWGIGVFTDKNGVYGPTGEGIESILKSQGHTVTNISKAGGSNGLMLDRLAHRWGNTGRCIFGVDMQDLVKFDLNNIDIVIFLQTDIFRERHYYGKQYPEDQYTQWKILEQSFVDSLQNYATLQDYINEYFTKLYTELNSHGKKIICIGGWSQLHSSIVSYANLIPAIPSATKLLIPELIEDCYLSDPEWYIQLSEDQQFMKKFGKEIKPMSIVNADKLNLVYRYWNEVHPNLSGYEFLVEKIQKYLL